MLLHRDEVTIIGISGKQITTVSDGIETIEFKYNADGLRTYKNNSDYTTYYYYDSYNNMIAMRKGGSIMYFYYDSEGNVVSMTFEGTRYYYVKNQQGDVEKIVNKLGNVVVTYKYDAWGNPCGMTDSTSSTYGIGTMNPFRYRGYVYDDETGLYYLKSRYYDPQTGRFLNADVYCDTKTGSPLSVNMFAYCENNAIIKCDVSGKIAFIIIGGVVTAIVAGATCGVLINKLTLTVEMYVYAYTGAQNDNNLSYSETDELFGEIMKDKLKKSLTIKAIVKKCVEEIKDKKAPVSYKVNGTDNFRHQNMNELDLELSIGRFDYNIKVKKTKKSKGKKTKYKIELIIKDKYDFNNISAEDRGLIISAVNNIGGYIPQESGILHKYKWKIKFTYYKYF